MSAYLGRTLILDPFHQGTRHLVVPMSVWVVSTVAHSAIASPAGPDEDSAPQGFSTREEFKVYQLHDRMSIYWSTCIWSNIIFKYAKLTNKMRKYDYCNMYVNCIAVLEDTNTMYSISTSNTYSCKFYSSRYFSLLLSGEISLTKILYRKYVIQKQ